MRHHIWQYLPLSVIALAMACGGAAATPVPATTAPPTMVATPVLQATATPIPDATPTPEPTAAPLPSGIVSTPPFNPQVSALRFYESGYEGVPRDQRVYDQHFASETTRYINWELNLEFPAPGRPIDFEITAIWYRDNGTPSGEEIWRQTRDAHVEGDWTWSSRWWSYGFDDPGNWAIGFYRVDIYFEGLGSDGQLIASNRFEIY